MSRKRAELRQQIPFNRWNDFLKWKAESGGMIKDNGDKIFFILNDPGAVQVAQGFALPENAFFCVGTVSLEVVGQSGLVELG